MNFAQPTAMMERYLLDNVLLNKVHHIEALDLLALLPDASVDAIITDLPYGTTQSHFDVVIPFAPMWAGVRRVLKPRGVFVTTASQPFTSALVMSNPSWFRYEWIWVKSQATGFLDANRRPLKAHENIIVFAETAPPYYPQMTKGKPYKVQAKGCKTNYGKHERIATVNDGDRYPRTDLYFDPEVGLHATQKPVALYRYLVRTYTQPGEIVLDFCSGSGTTGEAARAEGRQFILGEKEAEYVAVTRDRLRMPFERRHVPMNARVDDLPLFAAVGGD